MLGHHTPRLPVRSDLCQCQAHCAILCQSPASMFGFCVGASKQTHAQLCALQAACAAPTQQLSCSAPGCTPGASSSDLEQVKAGPTMAPSYANAEEFWAVLSVAGCNCCFPGLASCPSPANTILPGIASPASCHVELAHHTICCVVGPWSAPSAPT